MRARPGDPDWRGGEAGSVPFDYCSEFDSPATINTIAESLRAYGHRVELVEATTALPQWLLAHPVDLVFNIAEGTHGTCRESHVPAMLELLGIPFTGSSSVTLALALDKAKTKRLLAAESIPTPAWQLFPAADLPLDASLTFPLIAKPNREGSAKGILKENVVWDEPSLRRQLHRIHDQYHQDVLVEEYIEGTELTVGIFGNETLEPLPILEFDFSTCARSGEFFYSWRMKEYEGNAELGLVPTLHCPAHLDAAQTQRIYEVAMRTHRALGCRDLSRTDIRLRDGVPYVLEINPLPGLDPIGSNLTKMTDAAGLSHAAAVNRIVDLAWARFRRTCPSHAEEHRSTCLSPDQDGRQGAQAREPSATPPSVTVC